MFLRIMRTRRHRSAPKLIVYRSKKVCLQAHQGFRAARGRKKEAFGCHALLLQVRGDWA